MKESLWIGINQEADSWIGDETELQVSRPKWADEVNPMWSEKILTQYAISIEHEGAKTRYVMSTEYG